LGRGQKRNWVQPKSMVKKTNLQLYLGNSEGSGKKAIFWRSHWSKFNAGLHKLGNAVREKIVFFNI
jgi:hypothetical protein